jgi:hypothetical protein
MKPNKQFDCVKLKNAIQKTILEETDGMTVGELLSYFNSPFDIDTVAIFPLSGAAGRLGGGRGRPVPPRL